MEEQATDKLFTYGTLQDEAVQIATFGRSLAGRPAALVGYRLTMVRVEDQDFVAASGAEMHRSLESTGEASDRVEGTVLTLTGEELRMADAYEPDGYERVLVTLESGIGAWVYLQTGE